MNNNNDVNQSLESLLTITNYLLDKHAPMKQITKKKLKQNQSHGSQKEY